MLSISEILKVIYTYKRWLISLLAVLVIIGVGWFVFGHKSGPTKIITLQSGSLTKSVQVTGKVNAEAQVDLGFEESGRVVRVGADVGDSVQAGQTLVALDQSEARSNLLSAQANLDYEQATLRDSQVNLSDVTSALDTTLHDSYTKADDAVRNHFDKFFADPESPSPRFYVAFNDDNNNVVAFDINDVNLKLSLSNQRKTISGMLNDWKKELASTDFSGDRATIIAKTRSRLDQVRQLSDALSLAVNSLTTPYAKYKATVDGYKADIATARTDINTALSALDEAEQKWNTARLTSATTGSNEAIVSTQVANVKQAEAKVALEQSQVAKLSLISPITGVVTKQEAKVGETVTTGTTIVSVLSPATFEVEANIPEISVSQVKVGQPVAIILDAFPGIKFKGQVFYLDPAETLIDGVVNYKVKIKFEKSDASLKNGLTANVIITSLTKDNVVTVPLYAITTKDGQSVVNKYVNGKIIPTPVTLGETGDGAVVEVLSGVKAGDQIEVTSS